MSDAELAALDALLGLDGPGATRYPGDRVEALRAVLGRLEAVEKKVEWLESGQRRLSERTYGLSRVR